MTGYEHGLVLGKFYPPHAGHHHLVRAAAARCARLTVLVCASAAESIPLATRVRWMREVHPEVRVVGTVDDHPVDTTDAAAWDAHMAVFRAAVPERVDAVFSSEDYGEELARRFSAASVLVDPDRLAHPVSGTAVRRDPAAHWPFLTAPVRAALARRVVVLGAESSGTTTLARALAEHYRRRGGVWAATAWVPEYGRRHSEEKLAALQAARPGTGWSDVSFTSDEFPLIAGRQSADEEAAARTGGPVLFCDTDAFATTVWHERYLGRPSPEVSAIADPPGGRLGHLWLLTDHEGVPFEDDGLRDGEHLRGWMTDRFRTELAATGRPFITLGGSHEQRLRTAVAAVDDLLAGDWGLAPPLPERRGPLAVPPSPGSRPGLPAPRNQQREPAR